ncbi:MAG: MMPL family transporter [Gemmatimonadota bacterium]
MQGDATEARAEIGEMIPEYTRDDGAVTVRVAGAEAISSEISEAARQDFLRAEIVIIPVMLVLLIVVYRRLSPALLTLGIGLFSVFATMAALRGLTAFIEVSTFAANITLVMGIALGIDYSLFVISRFREELARGQTVSDAVMRAVETAGRTVIFSGLTVAASVAMLMVFPYPFLRSFGHAGILVVATALIGAVVILPAALAVLGHRVARRGGAKPSANSVVPTEQGFWYRLGTRVMRRPVAFGAVALIAVLALASPALGFQSGLPDDRILPAEVSPTRQTYDEIRLNFSQEPQDSINAVAADIGDPAEQRGAIADYARGLSEVPGIVQVNSWVGSFANGEQTRPPQADSDRFVSDSGTWLAAIPSQEALAGDRVGELVGQVRAVPAGLDGVLVGGYPAELSDFRDPLAEWTPFVAVLILLVTFVILFLMSGSLLMPVKATVLNLLSLSVMFGVIVFVFQEGNFAELLGFTPTGDINLTFPILMFCFVYGLSMDYEVFMMSRIKEEYDRTGDNAQSVLFGIQRSAPLITSAAGILALSFALYMTANVSFLQMVGLGTAIAVLVDATLIRAVLVPAFMRLAGRANWWAPAPLRRLHDRFGITESEQAPSPAARAVSRVGGR